MGRVVGRTCSVCVQHGVKERGGGGVQAKGRRKEMCATAGEGGRQVGSENQTGMQVVQQTRTVKMGR